VGTIILAQCVSLDRSLTYNTHLAKTAKKVATCDNLLRNLTGKNWGASSETLQTASLALVYTALRCG
jgi:hypothetical protein